MPVNVYKLKLLQKRCVVCREEKNIGKKKCKMCSLKFKSGVRFMRFDFCSENCMDVFENILKKAEEEKKKLHGFEGF